MLKIKVKQNPECPNKKYNAIFKHIYDNIRTYYGSKKICSDQQLGKYFLLGRTRAKQGEQVLFVSDTVEGLGGVATQENFVIFTPI